MLDIMYSYEVHSEERCLNKKKISNRIQKVLSGIMLCKFAVSSLIVILTINFAGAIKEHCNHEEDMLQKCSIALPVLSSPDISFALTQDELKKNCLDLRAGIRCIENYTQVCMEKHEQVVFRRIYSGITGVIHELCTPGSYQDEYLRHATCVKTVRPEYERCSKKYETTLTTLSEHQDTEQYSTGVDNPEDHLKTVCCSFQEYLLCSEQTVQRTCGDEAALFTSDFLKKMSSNIIKNFCHEYRGQECTFGGKGTQNGISLILVSVTILANLFGANFLVPT